MKYKTMKEAEEIASLVSQKLAKYSIPAFMRSQGYKVKSSGRGFKVTTETGKYLGVLKRENLIITMVTNGHDFTEFLKDKNDPDYKNFFSNSGSGGSNCKPSEGLSEVILPKIIRK